MREKIDGEKHMKGIAEERETRIKIQFSPRDYPFACVRSPPSHNILVPWDY
jgi:hypothetical protein